MARTDGTGHLRALAFLAALMIASQALAGFHWAPRERSGNAPQISGPSAGSPALVTEYGLAQQSAYPIAITTDSKGNVWFAEDNVDALVEFTPSNSSFRAFGIPTPPHLAWIWFLVPDGQGNLWFADNTQSLLWRFDPATGSFANFTAGGAFPMGLYYDSARGRMWFTSLKTNEVGYFTLSGGSAQLALMVNVSAPLPLAGLAGIVADPSGNVYVAEASQAKILELNGTNLSVARTWNLPLGSQPVGLALDLARGRLWFTDHASSFFGYVSLRRAGFTLYPTSTLFSDGSYTVTLPFWIQLSASGDVWFN